MFFDVYVFLSVLTVFDFIDLNTFFHNSCQICNAQCGSVCQTRSVQHRLVSTFARIIRTLHDRTITVLVYIIIIYVIRISLYVYNKMCFTHSSSSSSPAGCRVRIQIQN